MIITACLLSAFACTPPNPWSEQQSADTPATGSPISTPSSEVVGSRTEIRFPTLLDRCVWIKREIQRRLLEPEPEVLLKNAELLALEGTGATRLIDRSFQDKPPGRAILQRGGGAYYSFATRSHSYNSQPDIELQNGSFSSGFYGLSFGTVYRLGPVDLAGIDPDGVVLPVGITKQAEMAWSKLWAPIDLKRAMKREQQRDPFWTHRTGAGEVGSTYILRAWLKDEHDILVAFRIEKKGRYGLTIVWRKLKSFPMVGSRGRRSPDGHPEIPSLPPESAFASTLRALSIDELLAKLNAEVESANLLTVPDSHKEQFVQWSGPPKNLAQRGGFLRLLERGTAKGIFGDNVACYYSFANGKHGWDHRPEIGFEGGILGGGQHNCWKIDLGALSKEELAAAMGGTCPSGVGDRVAQGWAILRGMELVRNKRRELVPTDSWQDRLVEAGVSDPEPRRTRRAKVIQGHSYLFRTAGSQGDLLLIITALNRDAAGVSLAWQVVESFPIPNGR